MKTDFGFNLNHFGPANLLFLPINLKQPPKKDQTHFLEKSIFGYPNFGANFGYPNKHQRISQKSQEFCFSKILWRFIEFSASGSGKSIKKFALEFSKKPAVFTAVAFQQL